MKKKYILYGIAMLLVIGIVVTLYQGVNSISNFMSWTGFKYWCCFGANLVSGLMIK